MYSTEHAVTIIQLVDALQSAGSWCGETHIQKAAYILHSLEAPGFDWTFTLYKHGPFSFDLRDELTMMRADSLLQRVVPSRNYGPRYQLGPASESFLARHSDLVGQAHRHIDFVTEFIGARSVADLERVSTALYVMQERPCESLDDRARTLHQLKPHIPLQDAYQAVIQVDSSVARAAESGLLGV